MSGPVFLSAEQIRMRMEAEERLRLVQDQFRKAEIIKRLMLRIEDTQKILAQIAEDREAAGISRQLSAYTRRCQKTVDQWETLSSTTDNAALRQHNAELDDIIETARPQTEALRSRAVSMKDSCMEKRMKAIHAREPQTDESAEERRAARPPIPAELIRSESERLTSLIDTIETRAKRIKALQGSDFDRLRARIKMLNGTGKRENSMIYQDLHQFDVMVLQPLLDRLEKAEEAYDRLDRELSDELAAYHAICAEYGIAPKAFAFRPESAQEIRYEMADILQHHCLAVNCTEIIAQVRKVLSSMGYTYIGEKEEDRQVIRQIYRVHDRTILHVIFDSTGRVTMEVAIESEDDRMPSGREVQQIVSDQGSFCKGFDQLLNLLNSDGLHMRKDMLCPGGAEYAQVINTSGFRKEPEAQRSYDYSIYETPETKYLEMR